MRYVAIAVLSAMCLAGCARTPAPAKRTSATARDYPWPAATAGYEPIAARFAPPRGFTRVPIAAGSWSEWLRNLPMRAAGTPVRSLGRDVILPGESPLLAGVVDIDVRRNQECADTILRLWAEYLRSAGRDAEIVFHATSGDRLSWIEWRSGIRPRLAGNRLRCSRRAQPDFSRASYDGFLACVFSYCGTLSLAAGGRAVRVADAAIGDFFVHGASPGHAVLIADLARDDAGQLTALLIEGYMPAQSVYVMASDRGAAWFALDPGRPLYVPRWGGAFDPSELRRFGGK
jgi:Domain of unknown function (4846)